MGLRCEGEGGREGEGQGGGQGGGQGEGQGEGQDETGCVLGWAWASTDVWPATAAAWADEGSLDHIARRAATMVVDVRVAMSIVRQVRLVREASIAERARGSAPLAVG